jgi:hypothetical protein
MNPEKIFNLHQHPIQDARYTQTCKAQLDSIGALVMENFLSVDTVESLQKEARKMRPLAYFCSQNHNAYLLDSDPSLPDEHIRNLEQVSDKGCVPHDQIPSHSPLRTLYEWPVFRAFLESVLDLSVYPYADKLSSINEYLEKVRDREAGEQGFADTEAVIKANLQPKTLAMGDGALVLFRGRNSLHRVAPVASVQARILVTLNFNTESGVMLSELVRTTFFGRTE